MAIADRQRPVSGVEGEMKLFRLCSFWQPVGAGGKTKTSAAASNRHHNHNHNHSNSSSSSMQNLTSSYARGAKPKTVSSVARSFLPARRRLRLDPADEPGKQVRSAVRLKNTTRSHVAFKFQTTAPKSCYMRPPGAVLAPGESLIATVFKFVEQPENNEKPMEQKCKVKFKIMSVKVNGGIEYIPELFDEQKDQVTVEQVLRVVFLDAERPTPALEKLKRQLAEAEAALETSKKPQPETGPKVIGEGLVIDEWKERREKYLAGQQVAGVGST